MPEKIILIGASGHARAVADVIVLEGRYEIVGLIDSFQKPNTVCFGYPVLGGEDDFHKLCHRLGVGHGFVAIGDNYQRQAMTRRIEAYYCGFQFVTPIHPSATLGRNVTIHPGSVIMPHVAVVGGSTIEAGCILNTHSSLDHNGVMRGFSSLGPGVITGGNVQIGECSAIGLGAHIIQKTSVGRHTVVGAGALVIHDIPDFVVAYGVPAKVIKSRAAGDKYI